MPSSTPASWTDRLSPNLVDRYVAPLRADRPVLLSFLVFLAAAGIVVPLSLDYWQSDPSFWVNVLAEAHGVLLDLLLFGCLLLWFDQKAERRRQIERYKNAIDDFLGWETEEAMYRIAGNIRRLNREGASPTTLRDAYLAGADLKNATLSEVSLNGATLAGATLQDADLSGSYLGNADLSDADLHRADLSGAHFGVFPGMRSPDGNHQTTLKGAYLREANLRDLRNATAETFGEAQTLYKARLDPALRDEIEEKYPELLEPRASDRRE
jgi:hypothetical protein